MSLEWYVRYFKYCIYTIIYIENNPLPAKLSNLNVHPLEVVSRDPQLQLGDNHSYLFNFESNICKPDV